MHFVVFCCNVRCDALLNNGSGLVLISVFVCRVYFFVFTACIYLMAIIGGYLCLYMLKNGGYDFLLVLGLLPILAALLIGGCVNVFTVSNKNIYGQQWKQLEFKFFFSNPATSMFKYQCLANWQ